MECPSCGSTEVRETQEVYVPDGAKAYKCSNYHTWLIGSDGLEIKQYPVDFQSGIDYEKVRRIVREEIDRAIEHIFKSAVDVMGSKEH